MRRCDGNAASQVVAAELNDDKEAAEEEAANLAASLGDALAELAASETAATAVEGAPVATTVMGTPCLIAVRSSLRSACHGTWPCSWLAQHSLLHLGTPRLAVGDCTWPASPVAPRKAPASSKAGHRVVCSRAFIK